MSDNQNESNKDKEYIKVLKDTIQEKDTLEEKNKYLKFVLGAIGVISMIVLIFFFLNIESDYEKGLKSLNEKKYSEALIEFQKVDQSDKEFIMAQSKINYINGLMASGQNANSLALMYLAKVEPSDEYYRETRILVDEINKVNKRVDLQSLSNQIRKVPDTVIIKEKLVETAAEQLNENEAKPSVTDHNKTALISIRKVISEFENQYQAAGNSSGVSMKNYLKTMDSLYIYHTSNDKSRKGDAGILEINKTTESWMQKRIELINELMIGNSGDKSKTVFIIKEEGDKIYAKLLTLLNT